MKKYSANEIKENRLVGQVKMGKMRKCTCCGYYVNLEDFKEMAKHRYEDGSGYIFVSTCNDCIDKSINDKELDSFHNEFIDDEEKRIWDIENNDDMEYRSYEKSYSPSNPWDAPGMSIRDFL